MAELARPWANREFIIVGLVVRQFTCKSQPGRQRQGVGAPKSIAVPATADYREVRGKRGDNMLEKAFYRIMARGTNAVMASEFKSSTLAVFSKDK